MPRMGEENSADPGLAKALIIGDGKCGKTDWAARAAMAGFNVLYLDGDVGAATINNMIRHGRLTKEAANRIYLMNWADTILDGMRDTKFTETWNEFSSVIEFRWNDTQGRQAARNDSSSDTIWAIKPGRMGADTVLVMDSWTGFTDSIMLAAGRACSVDIATASTTEMRPVYQASGLKATQALQLIRSIKCNVIIIAHPDEFTKTTRKDGTILGKVKEIDQTIEWTKMIPKSTSKPHGFQMPKYVTDVLWLGASPSGKRIVDARLDANKVSGGHWDDRKDTEEYSFANLVKEVGGRVPDGSQGTDSWLKIAEGAAQGAIEEVPADASAPRAAPIKVLDGTTQTTVKHNGMSSFLKKA